MVAPDARVHKINCRELPHFIMGHTAGPSACILQVETILAGYLASLAAYATLLVKIKSQSHDLTSLFLVAEKNRLALAILHDGLAIVFFNFDK